MKFKPKRESRPSGQPPAEQSTPRKTNLAQLVAVTGVATDAAAQRARSHPEFNRIAFLFRQGIQNRCVFSAQQAFLCLDRLRLADGLPDQTVMQYVALLGSEKRWVDVVRPLSLIASHHGDLADDARLRLAQVQLRILNRPDLAAQTLGGISMPADETITEAQRIRIFKRDELLATAQRIASHRQ